MTVCSLSDLVEAVRTSETLRIVGSNSGCAYRCDAASAPELKIGLSGVIAHDVADQVVSVWAGTSIAEMQEQLAKAGQCIPLGTGPWDAPGAGTVGGHLSLNLPHSLEAGCGSWRDWVLGLTVVRPDGTVAKAGSKAVKNVAGYDVQKLFVGGRGALGVVAEVILRTFPLKALPAPDLELRAPARSACGILQRTLPTDFARALDDCREALLASHPGTSTLYRESEDLSSVPRYESDWLIGWGLGPGNLRFLDPDQVKFMRRAKQIFDPTGKLNPGELGQ